MQNILEVQNLHKSFGKKQILKDISFTLKEGQILGFIGPNGAGKTTTIKLILGLQTIDRGIVKINGFDIKKEFTKAINKVGAIVENPDLYMYLTGRKNLELIQSLYPETQKERIEEVIKLVGLENRIDNKVSKYSLGMRQRLGIAASLLNRPNILILDEPTNGLDPEGIKDLRVLLKKLSKEEKMGILISSHNLSELESFCSDVCIIQNGETILETSVKNIKNTEVSNYTFELSQTSELSTILKEDYKILDKTHIKITTNKENIPNIIKTLIKKNILIYCVEQEKMTLEEAYLLKTGGNIID